MEKLTKSPIPPNVREQYDIDVQKWREEDKLYYETHNFSTVMQKVRDQPYVTFVGAPGSGKSATAHHIALKLQDEGYEVVPTKDVRKMEDYGDPRNPQVFVIDDVVGVFGLQKPKLDVLINYDKNVINPCMVLSRTLMTCRETVFNETLPYKPFLTKEENVIKLHSSDNALNDNDKKEILQKYGLNVNLISSALLTSTPYMFPLLCKLFSKETKFQALGSQFFLNPVQSIMNELNDMQRHNKLNYATLVLCMLNENKLSGDILMDKNNECFIEMKNRSFDNCRLEHCTDAKLLDALSAMEETYTKKCGSYYTFVHDSMFGICAYHYGKQFPDQILLYMGSSYISNSVKPHTSESDMINLIDEKHKGSQRFEDSGSIENESDKAVRDYKNNERRESIDLCIRLREDNYPMLAKRLYRDIQNMELYDVFRSKVLKHPQICQAFIGELETKSYMELKFLFLSRQESIDKIVSKKDCVVEDSDKRKQYTDFMRKRELLNGWGKTRNVRVISLVIYYGHGKILEFIVQQIIQHSDMSALFGNSPHRSMSVIFAKMKKISSRYKKEKTAEKFRLLLLSCRSGDIQTVKFLLPLCKKEINRNDLITWHFNNTPITAACEGGHLNIVNELVKEGADVNLYFYKDTPLTAACKGGYVSIVEKLLEAKADVNLMDGRWNTPLLIACSTGSARVVSELVKAGANVNRHAGGNTPLTTACKNGYARVVAELLKGGANVNLQNREGDSPLKTAFKGRHESIVNELVKAGADVNIFDSRGQIPLIIASKGGHASVMEILLMAGASVNLQNNDKNTILLATVRMCHLRTVKCLMEHTTNLIIGVADVNVSAVFAALILNKPDIVKYLTQEQNKIILGKFNGNLHLLNCLMYIRHSGVHTDSRDDVEVADRSVWCIDKRGDLWRTISKGDCDALSHLLRVGLDVDQLIQLHDVYADESDVRPLLSSLVEYQYITYRTEKVRILLGVGADVNVRVRCKKYESCLDREGVSVLERTRRMMCRYSDSKYSWERQTASEFKKVMSEIAKQVRRHSI